MKCIFCESELTPAHIEMEVGYLRVWLCDCSDVEYVENGDDEIAD